MKSIQVITSIEDKNKGTSYSVVRLAEALAAQGGESILMSLANASNDTITRGVRYRTFSYSQGPFILPRKLAPSQAMKRALYEEASKGTLLHVHGLWRLPNVYPGVAVNKTEAPLVLSPRGMLGQAALSFSASQKSIFWQLFQRRALSRLKCFHATAFSEVEDIRSYGLNQPVAIIPNGVDVASSRYEVAKSAGRPRQVLHLGRIHPKKGIDRLLRAWSLLGRDVEGWLLRIVGPSENGHLESLQLLARELDLPNVSFEAPLNGEEKARAYAGAEIFVLPTLHENFGMVVAEALAHGTPVISTVGAPWEGLTHERCGWWIDHGPESLAATLKEGMALSDEERAQMGRRGREWMRRDFSWSTIAEKMMRLYEWCAGTGERPAFVV